MSIIYKMACPICRSNLQIEDDIQSFVCMGCGNELFVHQRGGIIFLKQINVTNGNNLTQINNDSNTTLIATETTPTVIRNSDVQQTSFSIEINREVLEPGNTVIKSKIAELQEQKKVLKGLEKQFLNLYMIVGIICLAITYAVQPVVSSVDELAKNLAVFWVPILIIFFTVSISVIIRTDKNQKYVDDYINRLKARH